MKPIIKFSELMYDYCKPCVYNKICEPSFRKQCERMVLTNKELVAKLVYGEKFEVIIDNT